MGIRYIRVERTITGSWMTIQLPCEMWFDAADLLVLALIILMTMLYMKVCINETVLAY